jgi:DNA-binding NarL/FixJ family response regulator
LVQGKTSKEIARLLFISPATVAKHRENILKHFAAHHMAELRRFAPPGALPAVKLTAREATILSLAEQGLKSEDIALRLGISMYTVQTHRQKIYKKIKEQQGPNTLF